MNELILVETTRALEEMLISAMRYIDVGETLERVARGLGINYRTICR